MHWVLVEVTYDGTVNSAEVRYWDSLVPEAYKKQSRRVTKRRKHEVTDESTLYPVPDLLVRSLRALSSL